MTDTIISNHVNVLFKRITAHLAAATARLIAVVLLAWFITWLLPTALIITLATACLMLWLCPLPLLEGYLVARVWAAGLNARHRA